MAEDDAINQEIVMSVLSDAGLSVDVVSNGLQVMAAHQVHVYSMILMDCQMPELDGYDACRQLRDLGETMPIIALTGDSDRERCSKAGMTDCLSKPFDNAHLISMLKLYQAKVLCMDRIRTLQRMGAEPSGSLLNRLIELFSLSKISALAQLSVAVAKPDLMLLRSIAHRLKSSTANLGLLRLAALFETLESSHTGSQKAVNIVSQLGEEMSLAEDALKAALL